MEQDNRANQEEFKAKEFTFTVEHQPKCRVLFHVHASPQFAKEAYKKAIKNVSKEVSLPGFRKGKAPEALIIKKHSKAIDEEWKQQLANSAFPEAEQIAKIPVIKKEAKINFDIKKYSLEEGAELTFSFETTPTVPSIDLSQFKLEPVKRPATTDKEVAETIRQIRFYFAEWKPIEDRPVEEGDFVLLDVDLLEPPSSVFQKTRFEVRDHSMAQWMKPLVIGMKVGESTEGISTPDEELPEEEKAGFTPKKVKITLRRLEEALLPPLDHHYYQKLGVANEEELRPKIEQLLNKKADAHVKEEERVQAVNFLLNQHPFDLPPSFVTNETRSRMQQLSKDPLFMQQWQKSSKAEQQEMLENMMSQSEKAVRLFYLCNQLCKEKNIKISPEDLPHSSSSVLEMLIDPQQEHYASDNSVLQAAETYSRLILEKAEDYLITEAKKSQISHS